MSSSDEFRKEAWRNVMRRKFDQLTPATRQMFLVIYDAGGEHGVTGHVIACSMGKRQLAPYDRKKIRMLVHAGFVRIERRDIRRLEFPRPGTVLTYGAHFEYVYTIPPGLIEKPKPSSRPVKGLVGRILDMLGS